MLGARFRDEKLCSCAEWRFNCGGAVITANTVILQSSLLQRFTAESSRELSALRKLNTKQRQLSLFLILLFKLLTQFPFVSFLSISICSLSQSSLFSLSPSFLSLLIKSLSSSSFICIILRSVSHHDIYFLNNAFYKLVKQILMLELQLVIP